MWTWTFKKTGNTHKHGTALRTVFALCLALGITAASFACFSPWARAATGGDGEAVVGTVSTFYKNYLKWLANEGEGLIRFLASQPGVDSTFVKKIERILARAKTAEPGDEGYLDYDPVLLAQDAPEAMSYAKPTLNGELAKLVAYSFWSAQASQFAICVSLVKRQGLWRITDVADFDLEDNTQKCGGISGGSQAYKKIPPPAR